MTTQQSKVILVTGGAQGLGKAICTTLAKENEVIVADIQQAKAEALVDDILQAGGKATFVRLNVSDEKDVQQVLQNVADRFGRLDLVSSTAGLDVTKSITALTVEEWARVMNVHLRGPFLMARFCLPIMTDQGSGHIVNIVSTACLRAWTEASVYHATK